MDQKKSTGAQFSSAIFKLMRDDKISPNMKEFAWRLAKKYTRLFRDRKIECGIKGCKKTFEKYSDLMSHLAYELGIKPLHCICGENFETPLQLNRHIKENEGHEKMKDLDHDHKTELLISDLESEYKNLKSPETVESFILKRFDEIDSRSSPSKVLKTHSYSSRMNFKKNTKTERKPDLKMTLPSIASLISQMDPSPRFNPQYLPKLPIPLPNTICENE